MNFSYAPDKNISNIISNDSNDKNGSNMYNKAEVTYHLKVVKKFFFTSNMFRGHHTGHVN